ncbi:Putative tick transposon, partial [Caligus rogercresseyi]
NYAVVDLKGSGFNIRLISVYGPNHDDPNFFETIDSLFLVGEEEEDKELILLGDMNLVLEQNRDTQSYRKENNKKASTILRDILEKRRLSDLAIRFKETPDHTFFVKQDNSTIKSSRLDYIFATSGLIANTTEYRTLTNVLSDHLPISATFKATVKSDKKRWKLNVSLLDDDATYFKISDIITDVNLKLASHQIKTASHALKLVLDRSRGEYIKLGIRKSNERKMMNPTSENVTISKTEHCSTLDKNTQANKVRGCMIRAGLTKLGKDQVILGRIRSFERSKEKKKAIN